MCLFLLATTNEIKAAVLNDNAKWRWERVIMEAPVDEAQTWMYRAILMIKTVMDVFITTNYLGWLLITVD